MGSFDGAQVCDLVGIYILSLLSKFISSSDIGLYRDDGLIVLRKQSGRQIDQTRKKIIDCFKSIDFQIDIQTNLAEVDFLDVTFNLKNATYRPYKKPNDKISYIHTSSNHPPSILKQLPISIEDRLSRNSSCREIFNDVKGEYEEALLRSGFDVKLEYKAPVTRMNNNNTKKKQRKRKVIWFNPPFNKDVKTNIATKFLKLLDKHFPKNNKLNKIFNRSTVKVSYSCTNNITQIIQGHNKKIMSPARSNPQECNCRNECPLEGRCRTPNVLYQCVATTSTEPPKTYIGISKSEWKKRYSTHKTSFKLESHRNDTRLASYIWEMRDKLDETPKLRWSIIKTAPSYNTRSKRCILCLNEKLAIATFPDEENLLNKRSEMYQKCRHERQYILKNYDEKGIT